MSRSHRTDGLKWAAGLFWRQQLLEDLTPPSTGKYRIEEEALQRNYFTPFVSYFTTFKHM